MLQKLELLPNRIFCPNKLGIKVTPNMENLPRLRSKPAAIFCYAQTFWNLWGIDYVLKTYQKYPSVKELGHSCYSRIAEQIGGDVLTRVRGLLL